MTPGDQINASDGDVGIVVSVTNFIIVILWNDHNRGIVCQEYGRHSAENAVSRRGGNLWRVLCTGDGR